MSRRRRRTALAAVVALALSGCDREAGSGAASPTTSSSAAGTAPVGEGAPRGVESPHGAPPLGETTGPTSPPAPEFAVPAAIDAAYVERVVAELDRVQGDVVRTIVATRTYGPDEEVSIRAVFNDPEFAVQSEVFRRLVQNVDQARNPPGDNRSHVVSLVSATATCITAETLVDVSATALEPPPPYRVFVVLRPTQGGADPQDRNRTPWSIADELAEPRDACG